MAADRLNKELLARILVGLILLGIPLGFMFFGFDSTEAGLLIKGSIPETGGWDPGTIRAEVGQPLELHLTSNDVVHGFSVGRFDAPEVDVLPGEITQTSLLFSEPGRYVYYCTRWCGPNHWRMRGTIIVGEVGQAEREPALPLFVELGLDLDLKRSADILPDTNPSWQDGLEILGNISGKELNAYYDPNYLQTTSPESVWKSLDDEEFAEELSDQELWNITAALWRSSTTRENIQTGQDLFNQNCAACHGLGGDGEGIFARQYSPGSMGSSDLMAEIKTPADFTNSNQMLATSSAILEGKIIRGGMGTGMPNFGPIFSEAEIWSMIDYIWTFQFSDPDR